MSEFCFCIAFVSMTCFLVFDIVIGCRVVCRVVCWFNLSAISILDLPVGVFVIGSCHSWFFVLFFPPLGAASTSLSSSSADMLKSVLITDCTECGDFGAVFLGSSGVDPGDRVLLVELLV
jgi:hypothetical protein